MQRSTSTSTSTVTATSIARRSPDVNGNARPGMTRDDRVLKAWGSMLRDAAQGDQGPARDIMALIPSGAGVMVLLKPDAAARPASEVERVVRAHLAEVGITDCEVVFPALMRELPITVATPNETFAAFCDTPPAHPKAVAPQGPRMSSLDVQLLSGKTQRSEDSGDEKLAATARALNKRLNAEDPAVFIPALAEAEEFLLLLPVGPQSEARMKNLERSVKWQGEFLEDTRRDRTRMAGALTERLGSSDPGVARAALTETARYLCAPTTPFYVEREVLDGLRATAQQTGQALMRGDGDTQVASSLSEIERAPAVWAAQPLPPAPKPRARSRTVEEGRGLPPPPVRQ